MDERLERISKAADYVAARLGERKIGRASCRERV